MISFKPYLIKNLIKKWAKDPNIQLTKEDTQMENKNVKICSVSYIIREWQISNMEYHDTC